MKINPELFAYHFSSFKDFAENVNLSGVVLRCYDDNSDEAYWKMCVGSFPFGDDLALIMVDAENCDTTEELKTSVEKYGLEIQMLSFLLSGGGISIIPIDQLDLPLPEEKEPIP